VLTEVCHLLPHHIVGRFMRWVAAGGGAVRELSPTAADDIAGLMEKSDDLTMGLADASLVWLAELVSYRQRSHSVRLQVAPSQPHQKPQHVWTQRVTGNA